MPKYVVTFTTPMTGCCSIEAKDYNDAYRRVNNKTYGHLKKEGFNPHIEDYRPDDNDPVEVLEIEIDPEGDYSPTIKEMEP